MLRFAEGQKALPNMDEKELATELIKDDDFLAFNVLEQLDRDTLEHEVREVRQEKADSKQLWHSQQEDETFLLKGKNENSDYILESLETGEEIIIDWPTLMSTNWIRLA